MRMIHKALTLMLLLLAGGCITQFTPETDEDKTLLVVEGLITDQVRTYTVKLSLSMPPGKKAILIPVRNSEVEVIDDIGNKYRFTEKAPGVYVSDSTKFKGETGRKYKLHVKTNHPATRNYSYESIPVQMKPVPPIDALYYEKVVIKKNVDYYGQLVEGCQIYLDTHDDMNICNYYRWDFSETWKIVLPFSVENRTCWVTESSDKIMIKNTKILRENKIKRFPVTYLTNETDRLHERYSILVNQYSVSEDEYRHWEKLKNLAENVGSLYDMIPASVTGNIICLNDPKEKVLGYFSVSAVASQRIFIEENFSGSLNFYLSCITDTIIGLEPFEGLNVTRWVIDQEIDEPPYYRVVTENKTCADCTVRGTTVKPEFWREK